MTKQEQIEEMAKTLSEYEINELTAEKHLAEFLYNLGYRKVGENDIILTQEDMKKYAKDCIVGQETGLDIINGLIARAERNKVEVRKETVKEFAERLKAKSIRHYADDEPRDYTLEYGDVEDLLKEFLGNRNGIELE